MIGEVTIWCFIKYFGALVGAIGVLSGYTALSVYLIEDGRGFKKGIGIAMIVIIFLAIFLVGAYQAALKHCT